MANVLISFLGRAPRHEGAYRKTRYDFGDGSEARELAFFGWALQERIRPDRLVILGTRGSMWDHLFEQDIDLGGTEEDTRIQLVEAVEEQQVDQPLLDRLSPLLVGHLGCEVCLRLIPYAREEAGQVELLKILAEAVERGDELHLDVTHAFRHLPMIGLMGALYLRLLKGISVHRVWYGAYDPDTGSGSVHDLAGLLRIADWIHALSIYDKSGDYGVLSGLLGGDLAAYIGDAAFLEQVNRIGQARTNARKALQLLGESMSGDPAAELFRPALIERLRWAEESNFYQRQFALALGHLRAGNLLEATLGSYEAFISRLVIDSRGDPDNVQHREAAREAFDREQKQVSPRTEQYKAWDSLRRLRNALVHGAQPKGPEVQRALSDRDAMSALLKTVLEQLFDDQLPSDIQDPASNDKGRRAAGK